MLENNFITEIIAIITAIGVIVSVGAHYFINKKNNIATLASTARIGWIESVRKNVAELITLYHQALNETDSERIFKLNLAIKEKTNLLILYFGPNIDDSGIANLLDKTTNEYKNDAIVVFLQALLKELENHYNQIKNYTMQQLENQLSRSQEIMFYNAKIVNVEEIEVEGEIFTNYEFEERSEDVKKISSLEQEFDQKVKQAIRLREDVELLGTIMRIYLKVEWNQVKKTNS